MAQSQVIDWLYENQYRMYPLTEWSGRVAEDNYVLTNNVLLDLNLYTTGYPIVSQAQLLSISLSGTVLTFTFSGSNVFVLNTSGLTAADFPLYVGRTSNGSFVALGADCLNIPSGTHTFTALYVEPSLVYEMSNAWQGVQQISVSPEYQASTDETPYWRPILPLVAQESTTVLTGDIILNPGFNFAIQIDGQAIDLTALQGYGIPLTCSDQFLSDADNDCASIVSYINGIAPDSSGNLSIIGSNDVNIIDGAAVSTFKDAIDTAASVNVDANPHSIFVGLTFQTVDICAPVVIVPSS